ncbi:MAG: ABC transporter permease subunit [Bryobacteraceae bacterium]
MTLRYKAWRESQIRFLIAAALLAAVCAIVILLEQQFRAQLNAARAPLNSYTGYIYLRIYGGFARGLFLILALMLGLGGLQREKAHGSIGFTLALPLRRFNLVAVRAFVGLSEVVLLAALPVALVPTLSLLAGQSYPFAQCLQFALLWIAVGSAVFSVAFLTSVAVASEYTALAISLVLFYIYPLAIRFGPLRGWPLHIHYIMNGTGMPYFDPARDLLIGPVPWLILGTAMAVAMGLLSLAAWITQRQDFA